MITILIPTKNRSDFLIRLLHYYADTDYKHWICIGDSSNSFHTEKTKKAIKKLKGKLKIIYREYPKLSEPQTTAQLINLVSTPYLVFCPDDDFLIPNALGQCIKFLKTHSEYSVALGKAILFILKTSGPYGEITGVSSYNLRPIETDSGRERTLEHLSNYTNTNFGVHRTEQFCQAYGKVSKLSDKSFTEILPNCISCIQGKVKQLDCFYLVRQGHDRRYLLPDLYDWITSQNWLFSYQVFHNSLVEALIQQDGIPEEEAHKVVKQAFWAYLSEGLSKKFQQHYGVSQFALSEYIKRVIRRIPCATPVARKIKTLMSSMSLPALLNSHSPYHKDFMPVYNAVTKKEFCI